MLLVQTQEQYEFVYKVLVEFLTTGKQLSNYSNDEEAFTGFAEPMYGNAENNQDVDMI